VFPMSSTPIPSLPGWGAREEELKADGEPYKVGSFPFAANGRALAANATEGQVRILAHEETDRILGMHVVGPQASEIVAQGVIAMEFGSSAEDLALTCFAHPTPFGDRSRGSARGRWHGNPQGKPSPEEVAGGFQHKTGCDL